MSDNPTPETPFQETPRAAKPAPGAGGWEREVIENLVMATVHEKRADRRWRIFFRFIWLLIIVAALWVGARSMYTSSVSGRHTALVNLEGEIGADTQANADNINASLQAAFSDSGSVGVVLRINSPGGSPVQAGMINDEMRRLRAAYPQKPLYVVVDEMCASGGYYVAAAADKIYVDKASLVGSIGVLMEGFGVTGLMDKLGVERRLYTAGENKAMFDMFSPQNPKHKEYAMKMLAEIHQQFIKVVREGRDKRLKETLETFSGLVWTGASSIDQGLADGFGTVDSVARDVLKAEDIIDYTQQESLVERVSKCIGESFGGGAANALLRSAPSAHWK
ncbi:MAG: S49 family peptidase [Candidatus Protistobacter heckmanni]|nr:S49 family peptidase [Candidatus Protistobacter heckmanni]